MMENRSTRILVSLVLLITGFLVLLTVIGLPAAIIFALLWFEKVTSGLSQGVLAEIGIEFATVPMIIIGVLYGPWIAFILGFLGMPLLDSLRWFISPPKYYGGWPPVVPGPDSFVDGLTGAIAGFLIQALSFVWVAPLTIIAKNIMAPIRDMVTYGQPPKPALIVNIAFNFFLASSLAFVIEL